MASTHSNQKRPTHTSLAPLLALTAGLMVLTIAEDAQARDRCKTKPAVCRLAELRQARLEDSATAPRPKPPTSQRCITKPAVCSRLAKAKAKQKRAPAAPSLTTPPPRCTTKPAVCGRLRRARQNR